MKQSLERVTVTDISLCKDCQGYADRGFIALVEIDPTKSKNVPAHDGRMDARNAHRTGHVAWMNREAAENIFEERQMPEPERPVVFVEPGMVQMLESWSKGDKH